MKTKARIICLVMAAAVLFSMMTSCGNRGRILELISEFEEGCNSLDVKEILNTIDPRISDKYSFALDVMEFFTGHSSKELVESVFNGMPEEFSESSEDVLQSIRIDVETIELGVDTAKATALMEYDIMGRHFKHEVQFKFVYYADDWYISSIDFI